MLTVHHLETSRSQRILWLLEELAVPYDLRRYRRDPVSRLAPAALKEVHPLGKSPVLVDGDTVVAESGAIIEYLAERFGAHAPAHLAQGRVISGFRQTENGLVHDVVSNGMRHNRAVA